MYEFHMPDFTAILPEAVLILTALAILMEGVFAPDAKKVNARFHLGAILSMIIAILVMLLSFEFDQQITTFNGMYTHDAYTLFCKVLVLFGAAGSLAISLPSLETQKINRFEYAVLILLATAGMLVMISANDLISLFIGLELQALALYVVVAINRDVLKSSEAALKYFVLGALSTGMFLYGASFIYGFAGSTNFDSLGALLRFGSEEGVPVGVIVGIVFILASLAFKLSAVPFHMWTPDVYEGSPTLVTAFLAAAPKVAAMALFVRIIYSPFGALFAQSQHIIEFMALASMLVGAYAALRQTDLKRLLAYSSIGHIGYALVGVAAGTEGGIQGVLSYMTIYMVMTVGTFAIILSMRGQGGRCVKDIQDLSGLSQSHPKMALVLAIMMFSMAGIPPLAGFFAKFYVFMAAVNAELYTLAILGILSSVVAAFYYLRIIKVMYFEEAPATTGPSHGDVMVLSSESAFVLVVSMAFTLLYFVFPSWLLETSTIAARVLMN